jgi:ribosomal protein L11 methyltransferase
MFLRLSPNLVLRSSWRPYRGRSQERVLTLRAGAVFPPSHPSTRLCLQLLKEVLDAGFLNHQSRLLDVGCGSGVLMLVAAAEGVRHCLGVDLSWPAVLVSKANAAANGLAEKVCLVQGSTESLRGPFGLILANLPYEVQLAKVDEFTRLAGPEACLILSGFKDAGEEALLPRYLEAGWRRERRLTREEWTIELPPDLSFTWVGWRLAPDPAFKARER